MQFEKFTFTNTQGHELAGRLELPSRPTKVAALFAHCFTCGKDIKAAVQVSRRLADRNMAVLRFDFTGLGSSQGDFGNTHFSSNVEDLVAAAKALKEKGFQCQLLIGHSLGGAAVLAAAEKIPEAKGVVTIGAPAEPQHVEHLFTGKMDEIESGEAQVKLGGREFTIKKNFLEDIRSLTLADKIHKLRRALLVFHSPVDDTVEIENAKKIYEAALHPKSFVTLDRANHLLTNSADAEYVAEVIAAWAGRYLEISEVERPELESGEVKVSTHSGKFTQQIHTWQHSFLADEPKSMGGKDLGPTPYDLLLSGLGACTAMTLQLYANHKAWPLENVTVKLKHSRVHAEDCQDCEKESGKIELIEREVSLVGQLDEEQRKRILAIADKCPVHRTLTGETEIHTKLV